MTNPEHEYTDEELQAIASRIAAPNETLTDTGNAYRFARLFRGLVRYLPTERVWLVWDGHRLRRDTTNLHTDMTLGVVKDLRQFASTIGDAAERRAAQKWVTRSESISGRKAIIEAACPLRELIVEAHELDANPDELNTPNGILNLRTFEIRQAKITDNVTRMTNVSYDPMVLWSPLLWEYKQTFMADDDQWRYLMKILGLSLLGRNPYRILPIIYGPTTTGKTQLIEMLASILSDYMLPIPASAFRGNLNESPRPDLVSALPHRIVYAEEGSSRWELHDDQIKRMTGNNRFSIRGLYSNTMMTRVPDFTPLIVCNEMPSIVGADQALKRRLRVLPFMHSVLGEEIIYKRAQFEHDSKTRTALFTQLVNGCYLAITEGIDDIPMDFGIATMRAYEEMDDLHPFLSVLEESKELINDDGAPNSRCWKLRDFYYRYIRWIESYGSYDERRQPKRFHRFNNALRDHGWVSVQSDGGRWQGKINPMSADAPPPAY